MQPKVIIINGSGGCGKSTFITKCINIAENEHDNLIVVELSTVSWPKEVAEYCGWHGTKSEKDRAFLHDLKVALEKWDNSPNQCVFNQIKSLEKLYSKHNFVFFVNIREPECIKNFIEQAKEQINLPIQTMLVVNNNVPEITSNEADRRVQDYDYDYSINNSGTLGDLENTARKFLNKLLTNAE